MSLDGDKIGAIMAGRNVQYVKQDEPSFLKDFKQKVGYKEGPDINTKVN